jgi:hypothetical protein
VPDRIPTLWGAVVGLAGAVALPLCVHAQAPGDARASAPLPQAEAVRAAGPIHLDGHLDEPAWQAAPPITSFTELDPQEGRPVSEPTEVRIVYDGDAIYVGARLAGPVRYRLGRRDMELLDSDWFGVAFDSYHDHRTAFHFQVNPGGVERDAAIRMASGQVTEDDSWDAVWEVAASRDAAGWTVELRIPFSQLRFRATPEQTWGLQLERIIGSRQEYAEWAFTPKSELAGVQRYGQLVGLRGVEPGKRLEVLPYVVGRGEYVDPGPDPFRTSAEHSGTAGADLLYRVASDATLNVTIHPDFGQVEVDPAIVNLGVYETFFPEKRPFFVEGGEIFQFTGNTSGGDLFYSRRIGRPPQLAPPTAASDVPTETQIPAAVKLSGKTAGGWSFGVLDAVTARENAQYVTDTLGTPGTLAVEPLTNYFVGRARHEAGAGRSWVGGIVTAVDRTLTTPNLQAGLRSAAYAAGVDWRHEWGGHRSWALQGSIVGDAVFGSREALIATQRQSNHYFQRPDAPYLGVDSAATSLTGYSAGVSLSKQAGAHWRGSIAGALTSPAFEVNDLGFQTRTDRRDAQANLVYVENRPRPFFREYDLGLTWRSEANYDGDRIQEFVVLSGGFTHTAFWRITGFARYRIRSWDDRSTRGGPMIIRPAETEFQLAARTDTRKAVQLYGTADRTYDEDGGGSWDFVLQAVVQSPRWNLTLGPGVRTGRIAAQYMGTVADTTATATYGRRYLFAPLDFTQVDADIRLNFAFTPHVSLQTYVQPLIFSSDYGPVGSLAAPRTFDFAPYTGAAPSLDGTFRSLRGNLVLTWEWRPGSRLYVAWQHWRQGAIADPTFSFSRDLPGLFDARSNNIVVVKISDWLNF